jgi:hypothetical protein
MTSIDKMNRAFDNYCHAIRHTLTSRRVRKWKSAWRRAMKRQDREGYSLTH